MHIGILGGGIAGLSTAIALQKIGLSTTVFEAAPSFQPLGAGLALAANAMKGLEYLGLAQEIIKKGNCLEGFHILDQADKLINKTNSLKMSQKYGLDNFVIHRASLHQVLLDQLPQQGLKPGKAAIGFTQDTGGITVLFKDKTTQTFDHVIAADGINSAIRRQLLPDSLPRYAGYTCWRGVIENPGYQNLLASETWGKAGRVGWSILGDNKIYWFACVNAAQNNPVFKGFTVQDLQQHFAGYHHPIPELFSHTHPENLLWHDIFDIAPIPKFAFRNLLLIGDAAHATTPNMGQGACQAIEDAVILADELQKDFNFNAASQRFEKRRMPRVHWITRQSRILGEIAQNRNSLFIKARNFGLRRLPAWVNEKQLEKVYGVDF